MYNYYKSVKRNKNMRKQDVDNELAKLDDAVPLFRKEIILNDLYENKNSKYKLEYPNLNKYLQHCSIVKYKWSGDYYVYDFFRPLKRFFGVFVNSAMYEMMRMPPPYKRNLGEWIMYIIGRLVLTIYQIRNKWRNY
jgi:hypothetical protein